MNSVDQKVGANLQRLRIKRGYSCVRLAAMIDVTPRRLRAFETGTERLSATTIYATSRALEEPVAAFFALENLMALGGH